MVADDILIEDGKFVTGYARKNFKPGDQVICMVSGINFYCMERIMHGKQYEVAAYDKGNMFMKGGVWLKGENGWRERMVRWDEDFFELAEEPQTIDIEYEEVIEQKQLPC